MKRFESRHALAPPPRRPLKIFASDPMLGRAAGNRITIDVPNEPLLPGPRGARLKVIDYDSVHDCFFAPVDLDDPVILMQGGLDPSESDPRFHQQMVYAVAMKVIENFDRALGRTIRFRGGRRLRLFPHAFHGANAYYDRKMNGILFGYFRADRSDPGPNLPDQTIFSCLSHDIITHEMTHALVDRLRPYFLEPTNEDVLAFHEGFADIVALFQHFSFPEILRSEIERTRSDLRQRTLLVELAQQFGYATGTGQALRSALDDPSKRLYDIVSEPHERGSILVAAVFDAFFTVYQRRIRDLIRIATGGTGNLPDGDLHPDLVNRIASEASLTAQSILTMAIRAFDYLPPMDITFADYLRALVTADYELNPLDAYGQRSAMIEGFRLRRIFPRNVVSLADESLLWEPADEALPKLPAGTVSDLVRSGWSFSRGQPGGAEESLEEALSSRSDEEIDAESETTIRKDLSRRLHAWATQNAVALGLAPERTIAVYGFHWVFRVGRGGQLLIELVAQFMQKDDANEVDFGGVPRRGGTTVVAAMDGTVRYVIAKPLPSGRLSSEHQAEAAARLERQRDFVEQCDRSDPHLAWCRPDYLESRIARKMNFRALHEGML